MKINDVIFAAAVVLLMSSAAFAQTAEELIDDLSEPEKAPAAVFRLAEMGDIANDKLRRQLSSEDSTVRNYALWALSLGGTQIDTETIGRLLDDDDSLVRLRAVFAAASMNNSPVSLLVERLAADRDYLVRAAAATVLADFKSKDVTTALLKSLQLHANRFSAISLVAHGEQSAEGLRKLVEDDNPEVRRMACFALGRIGDEGSIDLISKAASDEEPNVAVSASIALALLRQDEAYSLLEEALKRRGQSPGGLPEIMKRIANVLSGLKKTENADKAEIFRELGEYGVLPPVPDLVEEVRKAKKPGVRAAAARALGEIGSDLALGALNEAAGYRETDVRLAVTEALGKIATRECTAALRNLSYDPDPAVRAAAATSLSKLDIRDLSPIFKRMAEDDNEDVREAALEALNMYPPSFTEPILISRYKKEKNPEVRALMVRLLGEIGTENALNIILSAAESGEMAIKREAVEALGNFKDEMVVRKLVSVLNKNSVIDIKTAALKGLGRSGSELALPVLLEYLGKGDNELAIAVAEALGNLGSKDALPALTKQFEEAKGERASVIAETLGKIGDTASVPVLLSAARDPDRGLQTRRVAVLALRHFKDERTAGTAAMAFLQDNDLAAEAAAVAGILGIESGLGVLRGLLINKDARERLRGVRALLFYEGDEARALLMKSVRDEDVMVALTAAVELVRRSRFEGIALLQAVLTRKDAGDKFREMLEKYDKVQILFPLVERLSGEADIKTRMAIVEILGRTGLAGYRIPRDASLEEYAGIAKRFLRWWEAEISRMPYGPGGIRTEEGEAREGREGVMKGLDWLKKKK